MHLSPFIYDTFVTGKNFVGRKSDVTVMTNLLSSGENVAMYAAPKTGKMSLIQQTFMQMRIGGKRFEVCQVQMMGLRRSADFLCAFGDAVLRAFATTPYEYAQIVSKYFEGTHFVFDAQEFSSHDRIFSLNWDIDGTDVLAMFRFPYLLSSDREEALYVILDEFQNIRYLDDEPLLLRAFEQVTRSFKESPVPPYCTLVFTGSMVNAMKDLFIHRGCFHRLVELYTPTDLNEQEISDHINRTLLSSGKVIENEMMTAVCRRFRNNIWYIEQFFSLCDHLTKGYITEPVMLEALNMLLAVHEDKFSQTMADLTNFQVSFLRAVVDGVTRFSSADVIERYGLNSSANVKRVREALMKKEVITFDDRDNAVIIDPLFEYWVKKYFFGIKVDN